MLRRLFDNALRLTLSGMLALGPVLPAAAANAQAQPQPPEPPRPAQPIAPERGTGMDVTGNGVPIVNIAKPKGDGTSHNVFTSFGVGSEGVIFNNAGTNSGTQLGGVILGNPNIGRSGDGADLILNEVTGASRSDLLGAVEIAGKPAAWILANPYGVTCDGCGFIHTPRVVLSTGRA